MKFNNKLVSYTLKGAIFLFLFFAVDYAISKFLKIGLEKYYGLGTPASVALVGHSHLMLGIDKENLENGIGEKVAKYTREGVNVHDRDLMINQLIDENKEMKVVVYGVDAWMFTGEGLSNNSYKLFFPFMSDRQIKKYIKSESDLSEYWQNYLIKTSRYNEGLINSSFRGHLGIWSNFKFGVIDTVRFKENIEKGNFRRINSIEQNRDIFESSINTLIEHGIKVILLYVPTIDMYNEIEPTKFERELTYFRNLDYSSKNIFYVEYVENWEDRYEIFFDPIHLNPKGQKLITNQFINDYKKISN